MTDLSKIAHDIVVSLLPKILEENNMTVYNESDPENITINSYNIVEEYDYIHEKIYEQLQKFYGTNGEDYPR